MQERIIAELQPLFAGESSGHDLFHTLRVTRTAQRIASQLPCDRELVTLGALLHDADDPKLFATQDYANARRILAGCGVPYYRASAEVMAEVVGFHLNRGVLAAAPRPVELSVPEVLQGARTVAVLEGVNDHENLGSIYRNAAGLDVDAVVFGAGPRATGGAPAGTPASVTGIWPPPSARGTPGALGLRLGSKASPRRPLLATGGAITAGACAAAGCCA